MKKNIYSLISLPMIGKIPFFFFFLNPSLKRATDVFRKIPGSRCTFNINSNINILHFSKRCCLEIKLSWSYAWVRQHFIINMHLNFVLLLFLTVLSRCNLVWRLFYLYRSLINIFRLSKLWSWYYWAYAYIWSSTCCNGGVLFSSKKSIYSWIVNLTTQ